MASFKVVILNKPNSDNFFTIYIRIIVDRKIKHLSIGHSVKRSNFNSKGSLENPKWIRKGTPMNPQLNALIKHELQRAIDIEIAFRTDGKFPSAELIQNKLKGEIDCSFFGYCDLVIEKNEGAKSIGYNKHFGTVINKLKRYHGNNILKFTDLTVAFIENYEAHLLKIGNHRNTVNKNLKVIRGIINRAIREDIIRPELNPFLKTESKNNTKTHRTKLSIDEIREIEKLQYPENSLLWNSKNAFLFSYYCAGIRISDLLRLKFEMVKSGRLIYKMVKTGRILDVKISVRANKIIRGYRTDKSKSDDYIFPFLNSRVEYDDKALHNQISSKTALINKCLKTITKKAGIKKPVSMHIARHSFAANLNGKGANIYTISKALGHSDIKMTAVYLDSLEQKSVDEAMDLLNDKAMDLLND